jgi:hypothetical protein
MNTFEEILLLPGAAPILAAKLSGRIISRIADGFDDDPALGDMMNLFCVLENKWPEQTMSLRDMFELQMKDAVKESAIDQETLDSLTPEQRDLWLRERTKRTKSDKLRTALPKIVDLHAESVPDTESWDDLTTINQWSLLNAVERSLHDRLRRYMTWAQTDEDKGLEDSNAITLRNDAQDAVEPLSLLITEFLATPAVAQDLEQDMSNGIRVPERFVA